MLIYINILNLKFKINQAYINLASDQRKYKRQKNKHVYILSTFQAERTKVTVTITKFGKEVVLPKTNNTF